MSNKFLPVDINVKLAVDTDTVKKCIIKNVSTIPVRLDRVFYPNGYEAYIISAGPSMEKYVKELGLKEKMKHPNRGFVVFRVKHALPRLMAMGIEPDFCVILDSRDLDKDSTHGVNRKSLFEKIPEKTIFMVASMSNPGYAEHLLSNGARVVGWHTEVTGLKDLGALIRPPVLTGGTSSGTRSISIAHSLGIRKITLVGFDSCVENTPEKALEKDSNGKLKYVKLDLPVLKLS